MATAEQLREIALRIEGIEAAHQALRTETTQLVEELRTAHGARDEERRQDHDTLNNVVRTLGNDTQEAKTTGGQALIAARAADEAVRELTAWRGTLEQHVKETVSSAAAALEAQQRAQQQKADEQRQQPCQRPRRGCCPATRGAGAMVFMDGPLQGRQPQEEG